MTTDVSSVRAKLSAPPKQTPPKRRRSLSDLGGTPSGDKVSSVKAKMHLPSAPPAPNGARTVSVAEQNSDAYVYLVTSTGIRVPKKIPPHVLDMLKTCRQEIVRELRAQGLLPAQGVTAILYKHSFGIICYKENGVDKEIDLIKLNHPGLIQQHKQLQQHLSENVLRGWKWDAHSKDSVGNLGGSSPFHKTSADSLLLKLPQTLTTFLSDKKILAVLDKCPKDQRLNLLKRMRTVELTWGAFKNQFNALLKQKQEAHAELLKASPVNKPAVDQIEAEIQEIEKSQKQLEELDLFTIFWALAYYPTQDAHMTLENRAVKAEQAARELQELLAERNQEWFVKANRSFPFFINWKKIPLSDVEKQFALDAALLFFRNNAPDAATGRSERSAYLSLCHKNRVGARNDQNPFLFKLFDSALAWEAGDQDRAKRLLKEMLPQQAMDAAARDVWANARGASKASQALAAIDGKLPNHATVSNAQLVKDFNLSCA